MNRKNIIATAVLMALSSAAYSETSNLPSLDTVTVTATGVATPTKSLPVSATVVDAQTKQDRSSVFLTDQLATVPGAYLQQIGGEGFLPILRHAPTPRAFIVFAEDGIPVRGVGHFNHHMLNEINWYQADSIEVVRGPGSLLHGSQAMGGVINYKTRPAPTKTEFEAEDIYGSFGFNRLALTGGTGSEKGGIRISVLDSRWDGWRDKTSYDKQAINIRGDYNLDNGDGITYRFGYVDYNTNQPSGSRLKENDYINNPKLNYFQSAYNHTQTYRTSVTYNRNIDNSSSISFTPYMRWNDQDNVQASNLSTTNGVGRQEFTGQKSYGMLTRYVKDFDDKLKSRIIAGYDIEVNNGYRTHVPINTTSETGVGEYGASTRRYLSWTPTPDATPHYDYTAKYTTHSPYAQYEFNPVDKLRLFAGVRYDTINVSYDNKLGTLLTGSNVRPESQSLSYSRATPKLGATYKFTDKTTAFVNYSEGFRVPEEAVLFRAGTNQRSTEIQPTVATNKEIGIRSWIGDVMSYDITLYQIDKVNDILTQKDATGMITMLADNGKTQHRGVELSWATVPVNRWKTYGAFSYSINQYKEWVTNQQTNANFNGKSMNGMPQTIGTLGVQYEPLMFNGGHVAAEVQHTGKTPADDANTWEYKGHNLINLRAVYKVNKSIDLIGRVDNALDEKYATQLGGTSTVHEFDPGLPRAVFVGARYKF